MTDGDVFRCRDGRAARLMKLPSLGHVLAHMFSDFQTRYERLDLLSEPWKVHSTDTDPSLPRGLSRGLGRGWKG